MAKAFKSLAANSQSFKTDLETSMPPGESNALWEGLLAFGWRREADRVVAPQGTIWLDYDAAPAFGSLRQLRETITGRLERIRLNREIACAASPEDWQHSYDDTSSLLRCLDQLCGSEGALTAR